MDLLSAWRYDKSGRPLSGALLKWAAVITMLIDHIGASLIEVFAGSAGMLDEVDTVLRCIGRISFPLFCFLAAEGAAHTRSWKMYLTRLCIFAVVSEIPFDLAFHNRIFYPEFQNVYFTLALGLAAIIVLQKSASLEWRAFLVLIAAMAVAEVLHTDYGAVGVAVIFVLYWFRDSLLTGCAVSYLLLVTSNIKEVFCLPAFLLIMLYNGNRGRQPKHFFYWFYPIHMLILYVVGRFILCIS